MHSVAAAVMLRLSARDSQPTLWRVVQHAAKCQCRVAGSQVIEDSKTRDDCAISLLDKIKWSFQIASGMKHFHEKKYLHRSVATLPCIALHCLTLHCTALHCSGCMGSVLRTVCAHCLCTYHLYSHTLADSLIAALDRMLSAVVG